MHTDNSSNEDLARARDAVAVELLADDLGAVADDRYSVREQAIADARARLLQRAAERAAELRRQIAADQDAANGLIARLEAANAKRHRALNDAIVTELDRELRAQVARFGDQPRSASTAIAEVWRRLDARAQRELGAPLSSLRLSIAFVDPEDDRIGDAHFANAASSRSPRTCAEKCVRAIAGAEQVASLQRLLLDLEVETSSRLAEINPTDSWDRVQVARIRREWATDLGFDGARVALLEQIRRKAPPPPDPDEPRGMSERPRERDDVRRMKLARRDDGPLPSQVDDLAEARRWMREQGIDEDAPDEELQEAERERQSRVFGG